MTKNPEKYFQDFSQCFWYSRGAMPGKSKPFYLLTKKEARWRLSIKVSTSWKPMLKLRATTSDEEWENVVLMYKLWKLGERV